MSVVERLLGGLGKIESYKDLLPKLDELSALAEWGDELSMMTGKQGNEELSEATGKISFHLRKVIDLCNSSGNDDEKTALVRTAINELEGWLLVCGRLVDTARGTDDHKLN